MERKAFRGVTALATLLQCAMVLLGLAFRSFQQGNIYPIVGTLLALLAGFFYARWAPGARLGAALVGGALAAGVSSFLGVLLAALTGQASMATVLIATVTGLVSGVVGGFFGQLFGSRPPAA